MDSVVRIEVGPDGKIVGLEDRWNNKIPEGPFSEVSSALSASYVGAAVTCARVLRETGMAVFCAVAWWWPFEVREAGSRGEKD